MSEEKKTEHTTMTTASGDKMLQARCGRGVKVIA